MLVVLWGGYKSICLDLPCFSFLQTPFPPLSLPHAHMFSHTTPTSRATSLTEACRQSASRRLCCSSIEPDPVHRLSKSHRLAALPRGHGAQSAFRLGASKEDYPEREEWTRDYEGPAEGAHVQLRLYNIDRWGLAPMGARLLKKDVDGIYHVGVAVHGKEFWFDHQVNMLELVDVDYVRGFGPAYVYDMGRTGMGVEEVEEFVFGAMEDSYNMDTYDCFFHNCHHFANDVCVKLTGNQVPQWCIDHGEQGLSELSEASANITRIVSNKIARIMMVSWGRYSKERFVERVQSKGQETVSALDPMPIVGRGLPVSAMPEGVDNLGISKLLGDEGQGRSKKRKEQEPKQATVTGH